MGGFRGGGTVPPFSEKKAKWSVPGRVDKNKRTKILFEKVTVKEHNSKEETIDLEQSSENLRKPTFTYFLNICITFCQGNYKCNEQRT